MGAGGEKPFHPRMGARVVEGDEEAVSQGVDVAAVLGSQNEPPDFPVPGKQGGGIVSKLRQQRLGQRELPAERNDADGSDQLAIELESEDEADFVSFFSTVSNCGPPAA